MHSSSATPLLLAFALEPLVTLVNLTHLSEIRSQWLKTSYKRLQLCYNIWRLNVKLGPLVSKGNVFVLEKICQLKSRVPYHTSNFPIFQIYMIFFLRTKNISKIRRKIKLYYKSFFSPKWTFLDTIQVFFSIFKILIYILTLNKNFQKE